MGNRLGLLVLPLIWLFVFQACHSGIKRSLCGEDSDRKIIEVAEASLRKSIGAESDAYYAKEVDWEDGGEIVWIEFFSKISPRAPGDFYVVKIDSKNCKPEVIPGR